MYYTLAVVLVFVCLQDETVALRVPTTQTVLNSTFVTETPSSNVPVHTLLYVPGGKSTSYIACEGTEKAYGRLFGLSDKGSITWIKSNVVCTGTMGLSHTNSMFVFSNNGVVEGRECQTGALIWNSTSISPASDVISVRDVFMVRTDKTYFLINDLGHVSWEIVTQGDAETHPMYVADDILYGAVAGKNEVGAILIGSYLVLWQYTLDDELSAKVTLQNGTLFVTDIGGKLYALDSKTGKFMWSSQVSSNSLSIATFHQDSLLFSDSEGNVLKVSAYNGSVTQTNTNFFSGNGMFPVFVVIKESVLYLSQKINVLSFDTLETKTTLSSCTAPSTQLVINTVTMTFAVGAYEPSHQRSVVCGFTGGDL